MSSIYCQHGEYTHPWDCVICGATLATDESVTVWAIHADGTLCYGTGGCTYTLNGRCEY